MKIEVVELDAVLTEDFISFCCDQLSIKPDHITVEGWPEPFKNGALGLCYEVDTSEYLIMVSTKNRTATEIYNTIAHEMVHVKQFMRQDLGNIIEAHKPAYNERWWEIEAAEKSLNLVKKYVDVLHSMA